MHKRTEDIALIEQSGLFDRDGYVREYPDVDVLGSDPIDHYLRVGARLHRNPGPGFDTRFYLEANPDVAARGENPLLHYLTAGREQGRAPLPRPMGREELLERIDVVVVAESSLEQTTACLRALRVHSGGFSVRPIVVDSGAEAATTHWLRETYAPDSHALLIELARSDAATNGFARAANAGLQAASTSYVVLLTSHAVVTSGWLDGLCRATASGPDVGAAGPLTDGASWQAIPRGLLQRVASESAGQDGLRPSSTMPAVEERRLARLARTIASASGRSYPPAQLLDGFCLMVRRSMLDAIGPLDEALGASRSAASIDWCIRSVEAGFRLALADDAFVHLEGGACSHVDGLVLAESDRTELDRKHGGDKIDALLEEASGRTAFELAGSRLAVDGPLGGAAGPNSAPREIRILFLLFSLGDEVRAAAVLQQASALRRLAVEARVAVPAGELEALRGEHGFESLPDGQRVSFRGEDELCDTAHAYDIVVATCTRSAHALAAIALRAPHALAVYWLHDYEPHTHPAGSEPWRLACAAYSATAELLLLATSSWLVRRIGQEHGLAVRKAPPGVDHDLFHPARRWDDGVVRIGARIRPQEPHGAPERTMRILKRIAEAFPDLVEVHLFGCPKSELAHTTLDQRFRFENHGALAWPELAELLGAVDLFVDVSDYQPTGQLALAAMACGSAVVVPIQGSCDDFVTDDVNALAVDVFDEEAVLERVSRLITSPARLRRMQDAALEAASRCSDRVASVAMLATLREALARHRLHAPPPPAARLLLMPARGADGEPSQAGHERLLLPFRTQVVQGRWCTDVVSAEGWPFPEQGRVVYAQAGPAHFDVGEADAWLAHWRASGGRLLFDLDGEPLASQDDAAHDAATDADRSVSPIGGAIRWLAENADLVTVPTEAMAQAVLPLAKQVKVVPTRLRSSLWLDGSTYGATDAEVASEQSVLRIGCFGSHAELPDLDLVASALLEIERERPGAVKLEVVGSIGRRRPPFGELVACPRREDYRGMVAWLRQRAKWDVGILPIVDTSRDNGHHQLEFLQMAALGAAIVCSRDGALAAVAIDGETCLAVPNTPEDWYWAVRRLLDDAELRRGLAETARDRLRGQWTIESAKRAYVELLGSPEPHKPRVARPWHLPLVRGRNGKAPWLGLLSMAPKAAADPSWPAATAVLSAVRRGLLPHWISVNDAFVRDAAAAEPAPRPRPKVMVGTLHSGENELESCRAAIGRQSYPNLEHIVISGLRKKEAHSRLFGTFLSSDAEILVKIDADMVVVDERFIERVVDVCLAQPELGMLQMAILDYYSGGEIQGVNAYTKRMAWSDDRQDALFTDGTETEASRRKVVWATFGRSVVHSPNPDPFQAFHFGVHRGMKVCKALQDGATARAREQLMYLERTYEHYARRRTRNLLCACLGAEHAFRRDDEARILDYENPELRRRFERFSALTDDELRATVERLRSESTGNEALDELRNLRESVAERRSLRRLLLLLPHLGTFGGVNRFLEIARHARRQGVEAVVAVRKIEPDHRDRVRVDFPDVELLTVRQAHAQPWDAVLCGDYSSGLMAIMPWFDAAASVVYILNGWQHRHLNEVQMTLVAPDLVLANSSYAAEQYPGLAPLVVAGAVDLQVFRPAPGPHRVAKPPYRIGIACGRDLPRKRLGDAIAACETLHARGLPIELHLLNSQPIDVPTDLPVVYYVDLGRAEVAKFLWGVDAFLTAEEDAGWNNPAAEAMACGVPVVCTRAGTTDFALDGETAMVVPARDVAGFARALERVLVDEELSSKLRLAGARQMRAFSWAALTRNLVEAIESTRLDRDRRSGMNRRARRHVVAALTE